MLLDCVELQLLVREKEEAIAALRTEMYSEHSQTLELLQTEQREQLRAISDSLAQKTEELSTAQSELCHLRMATKEGERKLGSANRHISELQEDLARSKTELQTTKEQWKASKTDSSQLKVPVFIMFSNTTSKVYIVMVAMYL